MDAALLVKIVSRFVHVGSVITLLGGIIFARCAAGPFTDAMAARWKRIAQVSVAGALLSGLYNLMTKESPPPGYHMMFGIKFLLGLHVFAIALLVGRTGVDEAKRARMLGGAMYSGLAVAALSAYLRWMA